MVKVDQIGTTGVPLFSSGKRVYTGKAEGRYKISFLVLVAALCSFLVFSQMGIMFFVSLGTANMGLSMSATGVGLGAERSLKSFAEKAGSGASKSDDDEETWNGEEVWPKPYGWETYSYGLIRRHFLCKAYAHDQEKPLPTLEDWRLFQSKYKETVDKNHSFDDPVPPTMGYTFGNGGPPPYYAGLSTDGRGRGLFASRNIKRGEVVDDFSNSDVVFPDGMAFRRFIFSLPRNKACDMIDWTWTQMLDDGKFHILASINIASLCNGGSESEVNVMPKAPTETKFYATKDIKKGEQLLTNYGIYDTVWSKVGLGDEVKEASASDMSRLSLAEMNEKGMPRNIEPVWPKPEHWHSYSIVEIRKHFHCEAYARDALKPLPTPGDWELFRSTYQKIVDGARAFDDTVPPTEGYTFSDGGPPPFYAGTSPDGRGRGVFASRDIKKGELTHDGAAGSNVVFPDAKTWRKFVFALPRNRACDVLNWTWTQRLEENGKYRILTSLDVSVLHNGGSGENANVNPPSPTSSKYYATRDIKKDEELLTDYFMYDTKWKKVGLA